MTELLILFGIAMVIDVSVVYLSVGLILAEYKKIYLPLIKWIVKKVSYLIHTIINNMIESTCVLRINRFEAVWI